MNRVEGDVEFEVELDGNAIRDVWCIGTMYRGFEQILCGRDPLDSLVITPRICGICSTSQLYAAASALESAFGCEVAPNGIRVRNLCLMAEEVQSDARQSFLMFAVDFCNSAYQSLEEYGAAVEAFAPFKGRVYREVINHTKEILGVVVSFGAGWPHSTYMMPGGVTAPVGRQKLVECLAAIDSYAAWYERSILGGSSESWLALLTAEECWSWLDEHRDGALALFARLGRAVGLESSGRGAAHLLGYGVGRDPDHPERSLKPGGFFDGDTGTVEPFSEKKIAEHVRHSWFGDYGGGRHPSVGETKPQQRADAYTYVKAPRYDDRVVQVGPLADLIVGGDPLMTDFFRRQGPSTWLRQFARLHRPVITLQTMRQHVRDLLDHISEPALLKSQLGSDGEGCGLINAARGALGHWVRVRDGKIDLYQIITPTTWNGSPRDSDGRRGHWEQSLIGMEIKDLNNPIEVGHLIRSHDACLVCTVHFLDTGRKVPYPI